MIAVELNDAYSLITRENIALGLSILAIIISITSGIYFPYYFKRQKIIVTVLNSKYDHNKRVFEAKLVFRNIGNQYATILQTSLVFHQNKTVYKQVDYNIEEINGSHFATPIMKIYNPEILKPDEQFIRDIKQHIEFYIQFDYSKIGINWRENVTVAILVSYLNVNGEPKSRIVNVGFVEINPDGTLGNQKIKPVIVMTIKGRKFIEAKAYYREMLESKDEDILNV